MPVEGEVLDQPSNTQSRFWDMFSSVSSPATTPPPAYSELFPDKARPAGGEVDKKSAIQTAVVDAVADAKCAMAYDQVSGEANAVSAAISEVVKWPKKADRASPLSWLWVSESACPQLISAAWLTGLQMPLLVVMTSIFMHAAMPYISMMAIQALDLSQGHSRVWVG
jgi:hypothetical protein